MCNPDAPAGVPPTRTPDPAHVLICWLALLLVRVAENATGTTWDRISHQLDRLAAVTLTGPAGTVVQATEPTDLQRAPLGACNVPVPPRITALTPTLTCDNARVGALQRRGHTAPRAGNPKVPTDQQK